MPKMMLGVPSVETLATAEGLAKAWNNGELVAQVADLRAGAEDYTTKAAEAERVIAEAAKADAATAERAKVLTDAQRQHEATVQEQRAMLDAARQKLADDCAAFVLDRDATLTTLKEREAVVAEREANADSKVIYLNNLTADLDARDKQTAETKDAAEAMRAEYTRKLDALKGLVNG